MPAFVPLVPADVPSSAREQFITHYQRITKNTDRLFLYVVDHKLEHLNDDFNATGLPEQSRAIAHAFSLASMSTIGAFATHLGLIARYGSLFPAIPYIAKVNGKTNASRNTWIQKIRGTAHEPYSPLLWSVEQAVTMAKQSNLMLCGIGVTLYLGGEYEEKMLIQAAQTIYHAHQQGLVAIVWAYLRGRYITNPLDPHLIAGAVGVANALGADFVKIHPPHEDQSYPLKNIIMAAGNTGVICSGGSHCDSNALLQRIRDQLQQGARGCAIGRNIFQLPTEQAQTLCASIADLVYGTTH